MTKTLNLKSFTIDDNGLRHERVKGPLSGLRKFLTTESPSKMMKNAFNFMLKALFVLDICTFLSGLFGYVEKRLDEKVKVNSKIYDITYWTTNNYNTNIAQYL